MRRTMMLKLISYFLSLRSSSSIKKKKGNHIKSKHPDTETLINHHKMPSNNNDTNNKYRTTRVTSPFPTFKSLLLSIFILIIAIIVLCILFFQVVEETSSQSASQLFSKAAVSVDAKECAVIGGDVLRRNGSAVDSAIATLFCMGLVIPESCGVGGSAYWTILDSKTKKVTVIDARDVAPSYSTPDMFINSDPYFGVDAIAIPSEVAGSWEAHQRFGKLPWASLIQPTIDLARKGFPVGHHLHNAISGKYSQIIQHDDDLKKIVTNAETGLPFKEGEIMRRLDLANTLEIIAHEGKDSLYSPRGTLLPILLSDLRRKGSRLSEQDFFNHRIRVYEEIPPRIIRGGFKIYSTPLPASGHLLGFILDTMSRLICETTSDKTFYASLVEVWKFGYGQRTLLGDLDYEDQETKDANDRIMDPLFSAQVADIIRKMDGKTSNNGSFYESSGSAFKPDSGTAALSVLDPEGVTVSVDASVNAYFGSMVVSPSTGIMMNNGMDDFVTRNTSNSFGVKPSRHNRVAAGKKPLSSMCPVIITDGDDRFIMTVGASGGTQITSSISLVVLKHLYQNKTLHQAIDESRLHHQLYPMEVKHEDDFPEDILEDLRERGHKTAPIVGRGSIVMGIARDAASGQLEAVSDFRKGGDVDGF